MTQSGTKFAIFVLVTALGVTARPGYADPIVIDQTTWGTSQGGQGIINDDTFYREVAQTFTIINDGSLTAFDFLLGAQLPQYAGELTIYVVETVGGIPSTDLETALASSTTFVDWSAELGLVSFTGFEIPVTSSQTLGVVLVPEDNLGGTAAFSVPVSDTNVTGSLFVRTTGDIGVPPSQELLACWADGQIVS